MPVIAKSPPATDGSKNVRGVQKQTKLTLPGVSLRPPSEGPIELSFETVFFQEVT